MIIESDDILVEFTTYGKSKKEVVNNTSVIAACLRIIQLYDGVKIISAQIIN
jgi:hypothetical protein